MVTNKYFFYITMCLFIMLTSCQDVSEFKDTGIEVNANIVNIEVRQNSYGSSSTFDEFILHVMFFTKGEKKESNENKINEEDKNEEEDDFLKSIDENLKYLDDITVGEVVSTKVGISNAQAKKLKNMEQVPIVYLPDNPEKIILKEDL